MLMCIAIDIMHNYYCGGGVGVGWIMGRLVIIVLSNLVVHKLMLIILVSWLPIMSR